MPHKITFLTVCLAMILAPIGNLKAKVITIDITAEIIQLDDTDNLLLGQLGIGSTISGSYTYDSDTTDSNPSNPNNGSYIYTTTPYGISVEGGLCF